MRDKYPETPTAVEPLPRIAHTVALPPSGTRLTGSRWNKIYDAWMSCVRDYARAIDQQHALAAAFNTQVETVTLLNTRVTDLERTCASLRAEIQDRAAAYQRVREQQERVVRCFADFVTDELQNRG